MVTGKAFPGLETTVVSQLSAAVLQALGCPLAAKDRDDVLLPDDFERWRLAIVGDGAALGPGNVVHSTACRLGSEFRPVVLPDIALFSSRMCPCCETAQVAIAVPGLPAPTMERWLYEVENALLTDPPEDGEAADVLAQLRFLRLREGLDRVLGRFVDNVVLPVPLLEAVQGCRAWMTGYAEAVATTLRSDGLARLLTQLQVRYSMSDGGAVGACATGARAGQHALQAAASAVAEAAGGHVVCMFSVSDIVIDAAVVLAPHAATGSRGPGMQRKAVVVIPHQLAVYVVADFAVNHADLPPAAVFTAPADVEMPALSHMCAVALDAWERAGLEPRTAWTAALSACA